MMKRILSLIQPEQMKGLNLLEENYNTLHKNATSAL